VPETIRSHSGTLTKLVLGLLQSLQANVGTAAPLGSDRSLSNPSQFTIQQSCYG
jgi:hypothetical protein